MDWDILCDFYSRIHLLTLIWKSQIQGWWTFKWTISKMNKLSYYIWWTVYQTVRKFKNEFPCDIDKAMLAVCILVRFNLGYLPVVFWNWFSPICIHIWIVCRVLDLAFKSKSFVIKIWNKKFNRFSDNIDINWILVTFKEFLHDFIASKRNDIHDIMSLIAIHLRFGSESVWQFWRVNAEHVTKPWWLNSFL